jgi:hypothetical protein
MTYGNKTKNHERLLYPFSHNQLKINVQRKAKNNLTITANTPIPLNKAKTQAMTASTK